MKITCEKVEVVQDEKAFGLGILIFQGSVLLLLAVWVVQIRWNGWAYED